MLLRTRSGYKWQFRRRLARPFKIPRSVMKDSNPRLRCFAPITPRDLERLLELARSDRDEFFASRPDWARLYSDRALGTALCQGAALHYIQGDVGINDFDVYTFYASHPDRPWYAKRIRSVDFGDPKFGCSEVSRPGFKGRRVDLMARGLNVPPGTNVAEALIAYLNDKRLPRSWLQSRRVCREFYSLLEVTSAKASTTPGSTLYS
jgi:hypothetical protein